MKEEVKEVKIVAPDGYEIDKEKSSFEKIVFKKKEVERWRDKTGVNVSGWYITEDSLVDSIVLPLYEFGYDRTSYNIFATAEQAYSSLAMARISQIMENDKRFGGVVTDEEWADVSIPKYIITRVRNQIFKDEIFCTYHFLAFHTYKQRDLFIEENDDLVKDYLMFK